MNISRIKYLRECLEEENIDLLELSEIEEAFKELDPSTLRDLPENAMAGDMLDELEELISPVEWAIYDWVLENFGDSEANDPSWDIGGLAESINRMPIANETLGELIGRLAK